MSTPEERIAVLETQFASMDDRLKHIEEGMAKLVAMANRWRGAVMAVLGVGALIGWFADKAWDLVTRGH